MKENGNFERIPHLDRTGRRSTLRDRGNVYYIRSEDSGRVKIGWSSNVPARLKSLQRASASRLTLLYSEPGTGRDEANLHERFRAHRVHGEWFEPSADLLAHIKQRKALPPREGLGCRAHTTPICEPPPVVLRSRP